jgi:4-hydroxybenzoate polyprenyltransferase
MAAHKFSIPAVDLVQPIALYGIGSVLLRSAACVWNDICDVDIDQAVGEPTFSVINEANTKGNLR